jgi:aerobic-type carbon monoxide dehydrogenase small subunit (CoxS/CutS family)
MGNLKLRINGAEQTLQAGPGTTLLSALRDQLGLTGTKYGCGEGQCGACTVLIDGKARRSCLTPAASVGGAEITTIEGLAGQGTTGDAAGRLHPVQQAFLDEGAFQCAYCTSGMILAAVSFLREHPHPTEADIVRGMNGNMCRCGTYPRIVAAVRRAAGAGGSRHPERSEGSRPECRDSSPLSAAQNDALAQFFDELPAKVQG